MVSLLLESGAPTNELDANHATNVDSVTFSSVLSRHDADKLKRLKDILAILGANGGKSAKDL